MMRTQYLIGKKLGRYPLCYQEQPLTPWREHSLVVRGDPERAVCTNALF